MKKMDLDDLNFLPPWRDDDFDDEEGEEWKRKEAREASKILYNKWRELFALILAFTENLANERGEGKQETHEQITQRLIYENAMIIAPKIIGASSVRMYIVQMENASIIRTNAKQLMEQVSFAVMMGFADENYKKVIEEGMHEFRLLFRDWVHTFQKDDFEDDWGLFT
jgi:hypothetical protein